MKDAIISLAEQMLKIESVYNNHLALDEILTLAKKQTSEYYVEDYEKNGVKSFLVHNHKNRSNKFKVILNAHLDVVPGKRRQFKPFQKGNRLYGRGALDMKAAAAAEILVFKELAKKLPYPVALQIVMDEEIGGFNGTRFQINKGVRGEFVIVGEQTGLSIGNQAKGILRVDYVVKGRTAHSAYLWRGENAIVKSKKILNRIEKLFPLPDKEVWKTTVNIADIKTNNKASNQVPEECLISCDVRYIPEDKNVIRKKLKQIAGNEGLLIINFDEPVHFTDEKNQYLVKLQQAAKKITGKSIDVVKKNGASDLRHYGRIGCPGVEFGPKGDNLHGDDEWVDIQSLSDYYQILKQFLLGI
ncbi:M20 family metallopeptidase [Candidatus Roizmanbacteria bacterium]|jgi:succinyl-diaminopimelate desuccinylase|nr:M20 family metallopeptidase [Candidatus Roizmanbacteria bacterium]